MNPSPPFSKEGANKEAIVYACYPEFGDALNIRWTYQKIPRYFQFVESYPMTASGKVQKFALREQAIKGLGLEEVAKIKTA